MSKLIQCKTCGAEISSKAKTCPKCGEKNSSNIIVSIIKLAGKIFIGFIVFIFIIGLIAQKNGNDSANSPLNNDTKNTVGFIESTNKEDFEVITEPETQRDSLGVVSIKGSLKNTTGRDLTYAQITFALYDDDGAQIGTAVANINNLEKDGIWKYSATPMTMESWSQYKLTDIDCF